MTHDEIEQLSGEALRVAVAERVFGRRVFQTPGETLVDSGRTYRNFYGDDIPLGVPVSKLPGYESDIAAAFEVVERMRARGWDVHMDCACEDAGGSSAWYAEFAKLTGGVVASDSEPLPVAICRAALMAVCDNAPRTPQPTQARGGE